MRFLGAYLFGTALVLLGGLVLVGGMLGGAVPLAVTGGLLALIGMGVLVVVRVRDELDSEHLRFHLALEAIEAVLRWVFFRF